MPGLRAVPGNSCETTRTPLACDKIGLVAMPSSGLLWVGLRRWVCTTACSTHSNKSNQQMQSVRSCCKVRSATSCCSLVWQHPTRVPRHEQATPRSLVQETMAAFGAFVNPPYTCSLPQKRILSCALLWQEATVPVREFRVQRKASDIFFQHVCNPVPLRHRSQEEPSYFQRTPSRRVSSAPWHVA